MGGLSLWHWLVVLVVVLLVFGTSRLRNAGQDLGEAVKGFRKGMRDEDKPDGPHPDGRLADGRSTDGDPPGVRARTDAAPTQPGGSAGTDRTDRDPNQP